VNGIFSKIEPKPTGDKKSETVTVLHQGWYTVLSCIIYVADLLSQLSLQQ